MWGASVAQTTILVAELVPFIQEKLIAVSVAGCPSCAPIWTTYAFIIGELGSVTQARLAGCRLTLGLRSTAPSIGTQGDPVKQAA